VQVMHLSVKFSRPFEFEIRRSSTSTDGAVADNHSSVAASAETLETSSRRNDRTDSPGHSPARNFDIGS